MPHKYLSSALLFFFLHCFLFAQSPSQKEIISTSFERYFEVERENIHVQLDKNLFLVNEAVWFKGYVYNKKLGLPFYATTNVYVQLIDEDGTVVVHNLLYSISGFFSGKIALNKKMKTGNYYLQFYTNWMNNFEEDESYVQRIKIKNKKDGEVPLLDVLNPKKINLAFYPEGGNYISNVANIIGMRVTDINGKPIPDCSVEIQNHKNEVQKTIITNSFGMGKFEFVPNDQNYKAVVLYNNKMFEYELPAASLDGISLEVNNYIFDNKTLVKINAGKNHLKTLQQKSLYLVVQKNEKTNIIDIKLNDDQVTEFFFSNELLFPGVNSLRIIDSEMNELAQRIVFSTTPNTAKANVNVAFKSADKVSISGNSNWYDGCMSVAVLPFNSKTVPEENLITTLTLNSYLNEKVSLKSDFLNQMNRQKKYELDLMLLTQKNNKYDWNTIKYKAPGTSFIFEKGIDIKGTINSTTADLKKCRIQLKDIYGDVIASADTIKNNEFYFRNTSVTDSLLVSCSLIDRKDRLKNEMNYILSVIHKSKKFNKNYLPVPHIYPENQPNSIVDGIENLSFDREIIMLDEVEVKKEKPKLKRLNQVGNGYLRGYKVGDDIPETMFVLSFIEQNGFNVTRDMGTVSITGRGRNSLNLGPPTPIVYIDGFQLWDFDELYGMRMFEFDEIYISATVMIPSINNNMGIIKLYRKQPGLAPIDPKNQSKILVGGFETIANFENADYSSEHTKAFDNYGIIHWDPWNLSDDKGNFRVTIPNNNHKSIKLFIEGFSMDGVLLSEIKEINLQE